MHYVRWQRHGDPEFTAREMHGKSDTPEYRTWESMVGRCHNPNSPAYKYYGARGIQVCGRWRKSFSAFYDDMGARPNSLTLERVDNDGNYEPSNCRWATKSDQAINQRTKASNTSGVRGVWWHKQINKWSAELQFKGRKYYLGVFDSLDEARAAREAAEERYFQTRLKR